MDRCNLEVYPVRINISGRLVCSVLPGSPYVCMAAVTRESTCKESQNGKAKQRFCSVFRYLYLAERLLFMTESVQFGFVAQFSFYKAMNFYSHRR